MTPLGSVAVVTEVNAPVRGNRKKPGQDVRCGREAAVAGDGKEAGTRDGGDNPIGPNLADTPVQVIRDIEGAFESSVMLNGPLSRAAVAGPLSPKKPPTPVPAKVVMIPAGETFRMRSLP